MYVFLSYDTIVVSLPGAYNQAHSLAGLATTKTFLGTELLFYVIRDGT